LLHCRSAWMADEGPRAPFLRWDQLSHSSCRWIRAGEKQKPSRLAVLSLARWDALGDCSGRARARIISGTVPKGAKGPAAAAWGDRAHIALGGTALLPVNQR